VNNLAGRVRKEVRKRNFTVTTLEKKEGPKKEGTDLVEKEKEGWGKKKRGTNASSF